MVQSILPIGGQDYDSLYRTLTRNTQLLQQLMSERSTGNLWYGGPVKREIGQDNFIQGPIIGNLDTATGFSFTIKVPTTWIRVSHCKVTLTPRDFRRSVASATSGAVPNSSGNEDTSGPSGTVNVADDDHTHGVFTYLNDTPGGWTLRRWEVTALGGGSGKDIVSQDTAHVISAIESQNPILVATSGHVHDITAHGHPAPTITLSDGINEGSTLATFRIWIDGVDRSAALGGPWSAQADGLDITQYLTSPTAGNFDPVWGLHTIEITCGTAGAVEVLLDWYVTHKPVGQ